MHFIEYDEMVSAFAPDGTNHSFTVGILPGRSEGCLDLFDPGVAADNKDPQSLASLAPHRLEFPPQTPRVAKVSAG